MPHQRAIHRVKGMRIVGNVVDGNIPKQQMETIPRRTATMALRWSLMMDFMHSQNYKGNENRYRKTNVEVMRVLLKESIIFDNLKSGHLS